MSVEEQGKPIGPETAGLSEKPIPLESPNWSKYSLHDFTKPVEFGELEVMPIPKSKSDGRPMDYVIITRIGKKYVVIPTYRSEWNVLDSDRKTFDNMAVVAWKELVPPDFDPDLPPLTSPNWSKYEKYGVSQEERWNASHEIIPGAKQGRNGRMQRYTIITRDKGRLIGFPNFESPFDEGEATEWIVLNEKAQFSPDRYKAFDCRDVLAWQELDSSLRV